MFSNKSVEDMNIYWQLALVFCVLPWITLINVEPVTYSSPSTLKHDIKLALNIAHITFKSTNVTLDSYCLNTTLLSSTDCHHFVNKISNNLKFGLPHMVIKSNIVTNDESFQDALLTMVTTLSKYNSLFNNHLLREYENICRNELCYGQPCAYPDYCGKLTPPPKGRNYCYLKETHTCTIDLIDHLELQSPATYYNIDETVKENQFIPEYTPEIHRRLHIMASLQKFLEIIRNIETVLQLYVENN